MEREGERNGDESHGDASEDHYPANERPPHNPDLLSPNNALSLRRGPAGGITQPGGLSTANWSVISRRRDRKR